MKGLIIIIVAGLTFFGAIGKNEMRKEQIALEEQAKQEQQLEEQRLEAEEATRNNMLDKATVIQKLYLRLDGEMSMTELEHIVSQYEGVLVYKGITATYVYTEADYLQAVKEAERTCQGNWQPDEEEIIEYFVKEKIRVLGNLRYTFDDYIAFSDEVDYDGKYMTGEILATSEVVDSKEEQILYTIERLRFD